jgi:hypothetical protein
MAKTARKAKVQSFYRPPGLSPRNEAVEEEDTAATGESGVVATAVAMAVAMAVVTVIATAEEATAA